MEYMKLYLKYIPTRRHARIHALCIHAYKKPTKAELSKVLSIPIKYKYFDCSIHSNIL